MPSALTVTRRKKRVVNNGPFGTGPARHTYFAGNNHRSPQEEGGALFQLLQRPGPTTSNAVVVEGRPENDRPRSRRSSRNSRNNVSLLVLSEGGVASVEDDGPRSHRINNVPLLVLSERGVASVEDDGLRRRRGNRRSNAPLLVLPDGGVVPVEDVEDEQREQREQREEGEDIAMMLVCGGCGVAILSIVGSYYWLTRKIETPGLSW